MTNTPVSTDSVPPPNPPRTSAQLFRDGARRAGALVSAPVVRPVGMARRFIAGLGPGLIAGAADDDPSGISTYSTAGAAYGYGLLWTALFSFPLMSAVQLMCARVGIVSGRGLASVLRHFYGRRLLWFACAILLLANVVNIAADLGGMADVTAMLTGVNSALYEPLYAILITVLLVFGRYRTIVRVFKWLTLVLFAYVITAFLVHPHWPRVLEATLVPRIVPDSQYAMTLVAILGTTISPYLFFWQAAQAVEDDRSKRQQASSPMPAEVELRAARSDVLTGMLFSNVVMFFIILTTGATLYPTGHREISTALEASQALRPIAGDSAALLFALGIIGTGLLGVPVLAGSAAYAVAEAGGWRRGMDERPFRAWRFYVVLVVAMCAGMAMDLAKLNAITMLFWSAVLNGVLAPPLIAIILVVCNDRRVMGEHVNGRWLNIFGVAAALAMTAAAAVFLLTLVGHRLAA